MKKNLLIIGCLILSFSYAICQTNLYGIDNFRHIQQSFYSDFDPLNIDTTEGGTMRQFFKWERFWGPRLMPTYSFELANQLRHDYIQSFSMENRNSEVQSNWKELGPNANGLGGIGRIDAIAFHPTDPNILYAGAPSGGLWKSDNKGQSWWNLNSDFQFQSIGVSSIAIDHNNPDIIFIGTGDVDSESTFSEGIYRSQDGGNSWVPINTGLIQSNTPPFFIGKVILNPNQNNIAFAATSIGIYKCENRNSETPTWTKVYPHQSSAYEYIRNIEFHPDNPNILYAVGLDIVSSNQSGNLNSWERIALASNGLDFTNTPYPIVLNGEYVRALNMAMDPQGDYLYVNCIGADTPPPYNWNASIYYHFFQYDINNNVWSIKTAPNITPTRNEMVVSPSNSQIVYTGGVHATKTSNGGSSWQSINIPAHNDYHEFVFSPHNPDELFVGTDGGIWMKNISTSITVELNQGLGVSTMYNMGSSKNDPNQILTGSQDCGINYFKNAVWMHEITSDGMECLMDYEDIELMYATTYINSNGTIHRSNGSVNDPFYGYGTIIMNSGTHVTDGSIYGAPLVCNPLNSKTLYQGRRNVWKIDNAGTGVITDWYKISNEDYLTTWTGVILALEIAPSNPDYIYFTRAKIDTWATGYDVNRLFKTTNGGGLLPNSWIDITPPTPENPDGTYCISDIAVSNKDPNKIWITYSGYLQDYKVKYYDGTSWVNYNDGLPNIPVNCIVYKNDSYDELYLGTDVGVYYRNSSMNSWVPFMDNLPNVIVNWLEINLTSNKLRAATYGRGLWESELACINNFPISITQNSNWTQPKHITGDVIIESGVSLFINSTIFMPPSSRIIVKNGAKLVVNGGTITNGCSSPWQGIEVWGNTAQHQWPDVNGVYMQGYVELNNATIENAMCALDLWQPGDYTKTGGIVFADEKTKFNNNIRSVHALNYRNFHPNDSTKTMDYQAVFNDCSFAIKGDFHNLFTFYKHIDLCQVNGVRFNGCDFSLSPEALDISDYNQAIAAYSAGFKVNAICNSTQTPCLETEYDKCTFSGFRTAIYSGNGSLNTNTFYVNRAEFNNNSTGIEVNGVWNPVIINSNFYLNNNQFSTEPCSYGIYLNKSTGFAIEDNKFFKATGAPLADYLGIGVINCETVAEIYKNEFTGLSAGNYAFGRNWENEIYKGLSYLCNINTNNFADFYVTGFNLDDGIQYKQGNSTLPAGNEFSPTGASWHFYNGNTNPVEYFYCATCPRNNPEYINNVRKVSVNTANPCLSHYGGNTGREIVQNTQQRLDSEIAYVNATNNYNNTESLYISLKDGGSTETKVATVTSAVPDDMWALRAQLLGDSPHLSEEVLKLVADKTDVFTEAAIFDILAANPDELKKEELLEYLEGKENPLPAYMIDILRQVADGTTYKTVLQLEMARYSHDRARAANDIIRGILNDELMDLAELRNWLDNLGGIESDKQIISSYLQEGNFTSAFSLANMLTQIYNLQDENLTENNRFLNLIQLQQTLFNEGRTIDQLTQAELAMLNEFAIASNSSVGAHSKAILEVFYEQQFNKCESLQGAASYKNHPVNPNQLGEVYGLSISVKPNPANEWAAFEYKFPKEETYATLEISDGKGNKIESFVLNGNQGQKLWDIRGIAAGTYIYTIKVAGFTKSGKLVISK